MRWHAISLCQVMPACWSKFTILSNPIPQSTYQTVYVYDTTDVSSPPPKKEKKYMIGITQTQVKH